MSSLLMQRSGLPVRQASSHVAKAGTGKDVYIGFPKGDYNRAPGRKGRIIKDDGGIASIANRTTKEEVGGFQGAVGGFPGGEAGLQKFLEEQGVNGKEDSKKESNLYPKSPLRPPPKNMARPNKGPSDADPIYVGYGKDELDLRKSGAPGRIIYDEAYKYPEKEDVGGLVGAVGGFAGGERALYEFIETGMVLTKEGRHARAETDAHWRPFALSHAHARGPLLTRNTTPPACVVIFVLTDTCY
ncbi:hypothetical protein DUNSADRAFT_9376 [Dunaliella salina]|uniref:Encoded protein n=1 Tax=Dunaliella salina TaxID=3046 RepID=A0ABQ7GHL5_DUNSA|nr:hypothetical protein DUNSADRAFT_9376 [Dunaliella salina]|eukprot:KAF5834099.1 hypothetical protein DUNSADRAFT_9376 [Dunaliella salina]